MALMWIEGFETFGTTTGSAGSSAVAAGMQRKYGDLKGVTSAAHCLTNPELAAGRNGGYSLKGQSTTGTQVFSHSIGAGNATTNDTWIIGAAVRFSSFPANQKLFIVGRDAGNFWLQVTSTGKISVGLGLYAAFAETAASVLSINTWHYIELKVAVHNTAGFYEVRVDGTNVLSGTGIDTQGASISPDIVQFRIGTIGQQFDDIYIANIDGTKNNNFLGRVVVEGLFPNADGDSSAWTPSAGTDHWSLVDDNPADDDSTYVQSGTSDATDLCGYTNLSTITTQSILGVQINTDVRMVDSPGDLDIKQPVKSGTTTSDGDALNVASTSYKHVHRVLEDDPATAAAWTASGVGGAQFGIKAGT